MNQRLLQILACPICKGPLRHDRERHELVCSKDRLAYPIDGNTPIMLPAEARCLDADSANPSPGAP